MSDEKESLQGTFSHETPTLNDGKSGKNEEKKGINTKTAIIYMSVGMIGAVCMIDIAFREESYSFYWFFSGMGAGLVIDILVMGIVTILKNRKERKEAKNENK